MALVSFVCPSGVLLCLTSVLLLLARQFLFGSSVVRKAEEGPPIASCLSDPDLSIPVRGQG